MEPLVNSLSLLGDAKCEIQNASLPLSATTLIRPTVRSPSFCGTESCSWELSVLQNPKQLDREREHHDQVESIAHRDTPFLRGLPGGA